MCTKNLPPWYRALHICPNRKLCTEMLQNTKGNHLKRLASESRNEISCLPFIYSMYSIQVDRKYLAKNAHDKRNTRNQLVKLTQQQLCHSEPHGAIEKIFAINCRVFDISCCQILIEQLCYYIFIAVVGINNACRMFPVPKYHPPQVRRSCIKRSFFTHTVSMEDHMRHSQRMWDTFYSHSAYIQETIVTCQE